MMQRHTWHKTITIGPIKYPVKRAFQWYDLPLLCEPPGAVLSKYRHQASHRNCTGTPSTLFVCIQQGPPTTPGLRKTPLQSYIVYTLVILSTPSPESCTIIKILYTVHLKYTVAYNCHSMKQFSWVTCYKTAVWPMTKQFSISTYDITAVWPMTKQFSNLTYDKIAVWPMRKQFSDLAYDKNTVWPMINLQLHLWQNYLLTYDKNVFSR